MEVNTDDHSLWTSRIYKSQVQTAKSSLDTYSIGVTDVNHPMKAKSVSQH